jgi:hypothetical protein
LQARTRFVALAAAIGLAVAAVADGGRSGLPTLYVGYSSADCTFKLTNDAGTTFTSIAPGTYQVSISTPDPFGLIGNSGSSDLAACRGFVQFRLTGPGVNLLTTLDYGDSTSELYSETFRAGATYTMQDDGNVAATRRAFTVAAAGAPPPATSPSDAASTPGASPPPPLRGALEAVVSTGGKLALTRKGKPIGALEAGRYTVAVRDASRRAGLVIQGPTGRSQAVTSTAYLGVRVLTVTLTPGRWRFFASSTQGVAVPVVS